MKRATVVTGGVLVIAAVAGAAGVGYLVGKRSAGSTSDAAPAENATTTADAQDVKATAPVQTITLARSVITESLTAYGTVVPQATDQQVVSAAVEVKIDRLLVSAGQLAEANQAVAEVEPSPDTTLQLRQAQNAADATARDLADAQERFNMKLATNQDLQTAQTAARDAKLKLADLQKRGAGAKQKLKAPRAGIVAKVDVTPGQIVAAGAPLLEVDDQSRVQVRLGVEPRDAPRLKGGMPVDLFPPGHEGADPVKGSIRLVTGRVNPDTRLVDVFVTLPPATPLLLDNYLRATVNVASQEGLIVPRAAALPGDDGYTLFTVRDGHAVKHAVTLGLQTDKDVQVIDEKQTLKPGDAVVVVGNYELDEGVPVSVGNSK